MQTFKTPMFSVLTLLLALTACGADELTDPSNLDSGNARSASIEVLDGLSVERPDEGMSVTMEVIYEDGNTELVTVRNDDEDVSIEHHNHFGFEIQTAPQAGSTKCSDSSYSLVGYEWNKTYAWRYRDQSRPGSVTKSEAIAALKHAFAGIQTSRNSCGLSDQVSARHSYLGTTSTAPNVTNGGCGQPDGNNVVGWGSLPAGVLGLTCTWSIGGEAVESDQRYNRNVAWFAGNSAPANCTNKLSLRAVATHEAGHTFGLGHSGGKQTMATSLSACQAGARKFGRGDVLGLRALY